MDFISGKKEYFFGFLDNLKSTDRIAILSHTDLDGLTSAIILKEVLKIKRLKIKLLDFIDYEEGLFEKLTKELERKRINKVLIADLGLGPSDEGYSNFKSKFQFYIVDHHPFKEEDQKNILKTRSEDCASFSLFNLTREYFKEQKTSIDFLDKLVGVTMISEFSYNKQENFEFIKSIYPEITLEKINDSKPGMLTKYVSSTIIYFKNNKKKVLKMLYQENEKKFYKYYKIVDKEIEKYVNKYNRESLNLGEGIHFYYFNPIPKFGITSIVTTIVSLKKPDETFISASDDIKNKGVAKISARNQKGVKDMNELMKKGITGLDKAIGGGHKKASAARILKKDLEKFKQNLSQ